MENIKIISSYTKKLSLAILERNDSISSKFGSYLDEIFTNITYTKFQEDLYELDVDIVIIDLATHDQDSGFTFVKHLRESNPYTKIIVFSMFSDVHFLQNCIRYDISGFITNECTTHDLKSFIKNSIHKILFTIDNKLLNYDFPKLEALDCIEYLAKERDSKVTIVSHYKGLPIVRECYIIHFDDKRVKLKLNEVQIKSLNKGDSLALSSVYLGIDILASVYEIDYENEHALLVYENFIDSFIHHRKSLRLDTEDGAELLITDHNKRRVKSKPSNISINHLLCDINSYNEFKIHSKLTIGLKLNQSIKILNGTAIVKDIFNTNHGYKMLMRFTLSQNDNQVLDNYLSLRVKKLIAELKAK